MKTAVILIWALHKCGIILIVLWNGHLARSPLNIHPTPQQCLIFGHQSNRFFHVSAVADMKMTDDIGFSNFKQVLIF
ncbi:MAG: hypothetical protein F6K17_03085 [Okeania sp. SIO3C4]|nr:hypothetical protein [Okeania sp. SIO3C4]